MYIFIISDAPTYKGTYDWLGHALCPFSQLSEYYLQWTSYLQRCSQRVKHHSPEKGWASTESGVHCIVSGDLAIENKPKKKKKKSDKNLRGSVFP